MKLPWRATRRDYIMPNADRLRGRARVQRQWEERNSLCGRTEPVQVNPPMPNAISITPDNVETLLADLPRLVRMAMAFGSRLKRGTLDVLLPDGRVIRMGGLEPGPKGIMRVHDYAFASRLLSGGDIGIAEAYLSGDWERRCLIGRVPSTSCPPRSVVCWSPTRTPRVLTWPTSSTFGRWRRPFTASSVA